MSRFVLEIGFEEMPARFQAPAAEAGQADFARRLLELGLGHGEVSVEVTPRRLALFVTDVAERRAVSEETVMGPPARISFDASGQPTKAALGFAAGAGVDPTALFTMETPKGAYVAFKRTVGGEPAAALLPSLAEAWLAGLSFPKSMRWGCGTTLFSRPVRWLLCLLDDQVIPVSFAGLTSGRLTHGHRVMAPGPFEVPTAEGFEAVLADKAKVVLKRSKRLELVREQAEKLARSHQGRPVFKDSLLEEVVGLTEYPVVLLGSFDRSFLEIPADVLLTSMESHQKSFGVRGDDGKLLPHFLSTLGLEPADDDLVRKGWQRVLRARLEDARFFWKTDRAAGFDAMNAKLASVTFLAGLGSMADKVKRVTSLAKTLAERFYPTEAAHALRAAGMAKADLTSEMVGEFPELQGIMGGHYARAFGESEAVAAGLAEQYLPLGPDSPVPATPVGVVLSLADKLDSLAGIFGMNLVPTGAADPYGLRRAMLGVLRILLEHGLRADLPELFKLAAAGYAGVKLHLAGNDLVDKLEDFASARLKALLLGEFDTKLVEAALGASSHDVWAARERLKALSLFAASKDFTQAVVGLKRAANIIRKQAAGLDLRGGVKAALLAEPAELALHRAVEAFAPRFEECFARDAFGACFTLLGEMRPAVDGFFDSVMVMVDDTAVRDNRLRLLASIVDRAGKLADFAALQV